MLFLTTNHLKNWQYHLKLSYLHQRLTQNRNAWNDTRNQKRYSTTRLLVVASGLTRRGELMASKHCSLSRCSSLWRVMTVFCREVRFFTPKTQFSSTLIPNLLETQPMMILQPEHLLYMNSTVFLQLLQPILHVLPSNPILNPNSQIPKTTTTTC